MIHLELADLVVFKPYLTSDFDNLANEAKPSLTVSTSTAGKTAKGKKQAKLQQQKKKKSKRRVDSDDDDDDEDDDEEEEKDDDDAEEEEPTKATPRKMRKVRMAPRPPCPDCELPNCETLLGSRNILGGAVHKEIFTFERPKRGPYKGREWESLIRPVIEKWGDFLETHY